MSDWLVLDEALKPEWEKVASEKASEILSKKVKVGLVLPTAEMTRTAMRENRDLKGQISLQCEDMPEPLVLEECFPFEGVFVLAGNGELKAQTATWCSYLEKVKDPPEHFDIDDLRNRRLMTFPRKLLDKLCEKLRVFASSGSSRDPLSCEAWGDVYLVPAHTWLGDQGATASVSQVPLLQRVRPNNITELLAAIRGVRRYRVPRTRAMGYSLAHRQNHSSYDGRICPVDTPESEMIGISLQLARGATIDAEGRICPAQSRRMLDRISWGTALIPFSHHNDGARDMMGAKNLRQAVPIVGREAPSVRTGAEAELVKKLEPLVEAGVCPGSTDAAGNLALGKDLLVAYLPWNGWNVDDALVVNRSLVDDFAIDEQSVFARLLEPGFRLEEGGLAKPGNLEPGSVLARFKSPSGRRLAVRYDDPRPAELTDIRYGLAQDADRLDGKVQSRLSYALEERLPLDIGDKLMGRHGNKGVVSRLLPSEEMPRLPEDKSLPKHLRGRAIDILLNPHGVLSRMNPGQLLETHLGWLLRGCGQQERDFATGPAGEPSVGGVDRKKVRAALVESGLNDKGAIQLVLPDGTKTKNPVVVGFQHFVRLHHVPTLKAQARAGDGRGSYNQVTGQPARGRRNGGGQRCGEMEVWALCAHRAEWVLEEMLGGKSDGAWAREWQRKNSLPLGGSAVGDDAQGFPRLLKDWLRAMCIDLAPSPGVRRCAQFSFLTAASEKESKALCERLGGTSHEVTDSACGKLVQAGHFKCQSGKGASSCGWEIEGLFPLSERAHSKGLKLGLFLEEHGYSLSGPLKRSPGGSYIVELSYGGESDGSLLVQFKTKDDNATALSLTAKPNPDNLPKHWPQGDSVKVLHLRADASRRGKERSAGATGNLTAKEWRKALCRKDSGRSLGEDCCLTCPHHPSQPLKLSPPYDSRMSRTKGGLFDREIFSERNDWGYIRLPVAVDYPYWTVDKSGRKKLTCVEQTPLSVIPVLPLHYREQPGSARSRLGEDRLTRGYRMILDACSSYRKVEEEGAKDDSAPEETTRKLEQVKSRIKMAIADLFEVLGRQLDGKEGLLRHAGLGRRVDRSFRLVLTPNPELEWDQAGVPASVLWEILGDQVSSDAWRGADASRAIVRKAGLTWHNGTLPKEVFGLLEKYLEAHPNLVILLNRQPTLHRDSIQAFRPIPLKPEDGEVLQLPPICFKGFGADCDGDEMSGHYPCSEKAQDNARRLLPSVNLRSVATGACLANYDRDFVTGLELLRPQLVADGKLAEEVGLADCCAKILSDKARSGADLLQHLCEVHPDTAAGSISRLSRLAFEACTCEGISFGFFDLEGRKLEEVNGKDRLVGDDALALVVNSGANGDRQIRQIVSSRGPLVTEDPASSANLTGISLFAGMQWNQFFEAARNARYVMGLKKIGTQDAGALTRQLVLALWPWRIAKENCSLKKGERSVAACTCGKDQAICPACYGTLANGEKPTAGMPIGLLAAQALGERGTQLSMKAFHAGKAEIDISSVTSLMTRGRSGKDAFLSLPEFVEALRRGAYAEIDRRYFVLLWRVLKETKGHQLKKAKGDPLAGLVRSGQTLALRRLSQERKTVDLDSSLADVLFNLYGARKYSAGKGA